MSLFNKDISIELPDKIGNLEIYFFYNWRAENTCLFRAKYLHNYDENVKMKHDLILALTNKMADIRSPFIDNTLFINIKNNKELKEYMNVLLNSNLNPKELFSKSEQIKIYNLFKKEILKTLLEILKLNYSIEDISKIFKINSNLCYDKFSNNRRGYYCISIRFKEFYNISTTSIDNNEEAFRITIYYTK